MPHCILEYSSNTSEKVDTRHLFEMIHSLFIEQGEFDLPKIKSRAVRHEHFYVGDGSDANAFVHLTLSIFEGRSLSLRQDLGRRVLSFLKQEFAQSLVERNCSITVEIKEMSRDTYFKAGG